MTPAYSIVVDGNQDVTAAMRERLLSLRVRDEVGYHADTLDIRLDDRGGVIERPQRGVAIRVELGYEGRKRVVLGRYVVDEVRMSSPPAAMAIHATSADMRTGAKQRKTRSWNRVTINDLVRTIAQEHDLDPRVASDLGIIVLPHVDQTDESDLHLLTRLGEQYDAVARPADGRLVFVRRGAGMSPTQGAVTPVSIKSRQCGDWRVVFDDRQRYGSVKAYWYDRSAGRRQAVTAGSGEPVYALRDDQVDETTARYAAQARLDALNRGATELSLTLRPGIPTVGAGAALTLDDFRSGVDGRWITTQVTHALTGGGYTTEVVAELPTGGIVQ